MRGIRDDVVSQILVDSGAAYQYMLSHGIAAAAFLLLASSSGVRRGPRRKRGVGSMIALGGCVLGAFGNGLVALSWCLERLGREGLLLWLGEAVWWSAIVTWLTPACLAGFAVGSFLGRGERLMQAGRDN